MGEKIKISELKVFDAAEGLHSQEDILDYLRTGLEDDDTGVFLIALADTVRARGLDQVAEASGLDRETIRNSLKDGAEARFDTIRKVLAALGLRLAIEPNKRLTAG